MLLSCGMRLLASPGTRRSALLIPPIQVAEAPRTYGSHEPAQASLHVAAPTAL
jgi:hypothetical protein